MKYIIIVGLVFSATASAGVWWQYNKMSSGPLLAIEPVEFDFGKILQSGGTVSTSFTVVNNGSEDAVISGTPSSCSCTSGLMSKTVIKTGERAELIVTFDPNYHFEDTGRFFRTVSIKSNAPPPLPEIKIWVEVEYDLGLDKLKYGKTN